VERLRDPDDRRKILVRLTSESHRILDAVLSGVPKLGDEVEALIISLRRTHPE
jgi:DNA-binding MarR family transcriptional regulator